MGGSSVQSHDVADVRALGTPKGAFIIDIDQQLSDSVRQKNLYPNPVDPIRRWRLSQETGRRLEEWWSRKRS